jgi:hypothetical protein
MVQLDAAGGAGKAPLCLPFERLSAEDRRLLFKEEMPCS